MNSYLTISNTIDKYIIITFSKGNNSYPCHPYRFITENYSSKLMTISFWAPAPKSPAEGISKKLLNTSMCIYTYKLPKIQPKLSQDRNSNSTILIESISVFFKTSKLTILHPIKKFYKV